MADVDIAVVGAGPGGYVAAIRAAQYGAQVALIEKADLGGTCLNWGCIPSKALLESVHVYKLLQQAENYGLSCGSAAFDTEKVYARKDKVVQTLRGGIGMLMKKHKVEVITGTARLTGPGTLAVEGPSSKTLTAEKIILATGTRPLRPSFFPMNDTDVVDSDYFLALTAMPKSVCVIGGGYIGCEMATVLNGFGVDVTIVEMLPRLLPLSDDDVSKEMRKAFKKSKTKLHLKSRVESIERRGENDVVVQLEGGKAIEAEKVLVAIGREMCTAELGLETAGLSTTEKGTLEVNAHCQTGVPSIYAIGDIAGKAQLAHVASRMALVAAAHATGHEAHLDERFVPSCVFTQPEIGQVGLTEAEAAESGRKIKCAKFGFQALGKAHALGEATGFFKIVADESTGEILGVHVVGPHASDIIGEATMAMQLECTVEELAHTIHAHPTLHEGLMECAESWMGLGIHG